jgi:hypothetical protein
VSGIDQEEETQLDRVRAARPLVPLVPAEKQEEFRGYLETVLRGQSFTDVETQRRTREGSVVDVQISVARSMTRPGA